MISKGVLMKLTGSKGVGAGLNPPKWLVPGTQMDVRISQIGTLRNNVVYA
jgi:2-keto-4-pentenoate hydratase/2-oxohepta-3-ene-1,7-dioic acid hydratase in catechol pathway